MIALPDAALELLRSTNLAHLATINPDGSPQVTPVWVHELGGQPVMNTAVGRRKERTIRRDPRVTIEITDERDPDRYVEIRGLAELVLEGAREHAEARSHKYTGEPFDGFEPGVDRVIILVAPLRAFVRLGD